ncbi:hypothetical protein MRB53_022807 [Persea americana]|uniref:Uncharacterized protein n=1 Tax=Persea americana TaxID=3435 RepID=A0ACC2L7N6_PERAE|nr:hypothetical protein MRB53_022807 [Persea americana]
MSPSAISSLLFPARLSPSPVVPLSAPDHFSGWLAAEVHHLQHQPSMSTTWVLQALDVAVSMQKKAIESIATDPTQGAIDRSWVEHYLDDVVELLDACNILREEMEAMVQYTQAIAKGLHCIEGGSKPTKSALARAQLALTACLKTERRRCNKLEKCTSRLKKVGERKKRTHGELGLSKSEFHEVLSASKAMGVLVCGMLSTLLSFKRRGVVGVTQSARAESWASSLYELEKVVVVKGRKGGGPVLDELRSTVEMAREVRGLIKRSGDEVRKWELRERVEGLGRKSGQLEQGIRKFEGRVNELYRHLISIRVALLGSLTMA